MQKEELMWKDTKNNNYVNFIYTHTGKQEHM